MRARFPIGSGPVVFWVFLVFLIDRGGSEDGRQASGCERRRTDQAGEPRAARLARPGARRRHESFRGRGRAATQVPRRLPAGRPRRAPPTQRCRPRARLHLHGPLQDPGRGPHRQAIPRARRAGGPLRQRHAAGHDATGQPVSRRGEGRPEGYDPRAERRARHDARRLRRRAAQRDVLPGAAPRRVARSGVPDGPPHLRAPAPPHARLPRDLAQRRAGRVRGADARARSDLRRALSAAQVQDGDSVSGRQLHRRLQQRSGFPGDPRRGPRCRLQRAGRWRAGDDPRQEGHLPATRRSAGVCRTGRRDPSRRGGTGGAARLRRPPRPPGPAPQVPAAPSGARVVPRRGGPAAPLVHGLPGAPDVRPGARRVRACAARCDRRARGRARAPGARGPATHRADDGLSQRLRASVHGGPGVRGPVGGQVHDLCGRQRARHQARDGVRRLGAAAPTRRPGAAAARALPRRAFAGRGPGRFLLPRRHRRTAKQRRHGGRAVTHFYPAFLDLRGRRAVVVGGGVIAEQKVVRLLDAGARVTVISPTVSRRLDDLESAGTVTIGRRPYRPGDLAGACLAIAATDDRAVNRAVWAEAEARGVLLNAVDDLPHCSFIAPAIHRQGDVAVAISTAGKSPALAVRLRERIGRLIGPEYATLLELLGELRAELTRRVPDARIRTRLWYRIVDSDALEWVRRGAIAGARARIGRLVEAAEEPETRGAGIVHIVGAGPGEPGLITRRGLERLRAAEVVVYDRLVHPDLLEEAPPWAERIFVGKRPGREGHSLPQEQINVLLIETARSGRVVVRLKGGDPFVFGRGAEECEALRAAGVPYEVVPGVTSAIAAPGAAGIPVTHRRHASAFAVVAGHECDAASDLDWDALARLPALVFLMGLRALPQITARLIAHGMPEETPAAAIASATLPEQRTVIGTLATLAERAEAAGLEPPATLVVGDVVGSAPVAEQDRAAAGAACLSPGPM